MASKRLRNQNANQGEDLAVDMSPMIDMVFLLLIFFIVTANIIIVKQDIKVEVPIAAHSTSQKKKTGRIVINVYGEGVNNEGDSVARDDGARYSMADQDFTPFEDDDASILQFIKDEKEKMIGTVTPQIHLRGHRGVEFKHVRRIIRIAAEAGVDQVVFASFVKNPNY